MADQDQASTEPTPGKVLNPVPVTRPARQRGPQGWHSTWRKAPTCPAVRPEAGAG